MSYWLEPSELHEAHECHRDQHCPVRVEIILKSTQKVLEQGWKNTHTISILINFSDIKGQWIISCEIWHCLSQQTVNPEVKLHLRCSHAHILYLQPGSNFSSNVLMGRRWQWEDFTNTELLKVICFKEKKKKRKKKACYICWCCCRNTYMCHEDQTYYMFATSKCFQSTGGRGCCCLWQIFHHVQQLWKRLKHLICIWCQAWHRCFCWLAGGLSFFFCLPVCPCVCVCVCVCS